MAGRKQENTFLQEYAAALEKCIDIITGLCEAWARSGASEFNQFNSMFSGSAELIACYYTVAWLFAFVTL